MATTQARLLAPSSLSGLATKAPSISPALSNAQCKAWTRPSSRRNLSIRATSSGRPNPPSSPSGLGGTEVPLGANVTTAPLGQEGVPKGKRMAYGCSGCGYIYDADKPFENQPETYACPVCSAPRESFTTTNATLEEGVYDVTKDADANASPTGGN